MYHPHMVHAGFLMDLPWQQQILQQLLLLLDSKAGTAAYKPGPRPPSRDDHGRNSALKAGQQGGSSNSSSRTDGHEQMQHTGNGTAGVAFVGSGAGHGYSTTGLAAVQDHPAVSSCSSRAGSEHSYVSCIDGTSSDSSSTSSTARSRQPATSEGLIAGDQQVLVAAATVASQIKLSASPFSSGHHAERVHDRGVDRIDRISAGGALSFCTSGKLGSSSNSFNSTSQLQCQYPVRSHDGSLELTPSMCMRSWSDVLPCASVTDASTASESGQPESPWSWNTFVSASSVQSRRSMAAAAAAQEARQAAQMLLQPLIAVQQQQGRRPQALGDSKQLQGAEEQSLRRVTWGSNESGEGLAAQKGSGAAAGAECLVSYCSVALEDSKHHGADSAAPAAAPAATAQHFERMEPIFDKAVAAAAVAAAPPQLVCAAVGGGAEGPGRGLLGLRMRSGAGTGFGGPKGMLKRVEGLWQGRVRTGGKGSHIH